MRLAGFPDKGRGQVVRSCTGGWFDCHS
jgi:hypothetical protein